MTYPAQGDPGTRRRVPGGNPPMRPDQAALLPQSRAGVGPAPQTNVIVARIVIITGGPGSGVFIYSPSPGLGNLIGSWSGAAGVDQFGNAFPAGLSDTVGVLFGSSIAGGSLSLNPGPLLLYGTPTTVVQYLTGAANFTAPAGVTSVFAECWGASNNGGTGAIGGGGGSGGGEYAAETVAVTPASLYAYSQGTTAGASSTFAGDVRTVTAHGGGAGGNGGGAGGGGHGSTNTTHFNGGVGGTGQVPLPSGGGGGGGVAGPGSGGNAGKPGSSSGGGTGGAGGLALPGQAGAGGPGGNNTLAGANGQAPGGGAGGGGGAGAAGGAFAPGQVRITYTPAGGVGQLLASLASVAATDPATGTAYPQGAFLGARMPLLLQTGATPAAPASGASLFSLGNTLREIKPSGLTGALPLVQADHTVTAVTAIVNTAITKAWSVPAGDAAVDSVYRLTSWGFGTLGSTLQNLTWGIGLNGAVVRSVVVASPGLVSQSFRWYNVILLHVVTTGAGGTADVEMSGTWSSAQATTPAAPVGCGSPSAAAEAVNTTVANDVELMVAWASATGAPTITCVGSMLERLGP